jgi:ribosomal protein S12 methylthiotransferase
MVRVKYHIVTGLREERRGQQRIARVLRGAHHEVTEPGASDVVIVNTCGFIDTAKEESVNTILELAEAKRPGQQLVVAGCLTALHGEELRTEVPQIDRVFGAEDWGGIGRYIGTLEPVRLAEPPFDLPLVQRGAARPSAYLKISDGCNAPCTFCIIPKMKGKLHSASPDDVVAEARRLAGEGVREIVLVAQDSTDYGRDLGLRDGLPELLERISSAVRGRAVDPHHVRVPGPCHGAALPHDGRAAERRAVHRYPAATRGGERAAPHEAAEQHAHGA